MSTKFLIVLIILVNLIIFRYFATRPVYHDGNKVRITTRVLSDPIKYETSQYLKAAGLKVYLPLFPEITYGDRITVEGIVKKDKLANVDLVKLETSNSSTAKLRQKIISLYQSVLPEPHAGLLAGVTLGSKGGLTQDFWEKVKKTGVAHVVVASGMNVTFVTAFLVNFLAVFLPRRKSIPFVILGIILYLFISGFEAPLIRAAIMGVIVFSAQETGRLVSAWRTLGLSAAIMLVYRPEWVGDIGFILSFVATASLLLFEKKIHSKLLKIPKIFREGLSTSLAAQIGVTPILFVTFGYFNILSPVINALVLWTIPIIMIIGVVGGVTGLIFEPLGRLVLLLVYPFSSFFIWVVNIFSTR